MNRRVLKVSFSHRTCDSFCVSQTNGVRRSCAAVLSSHAAVAVSAAACAVAGARSLNQNIMTLMVS